MTCMTRVACLFRCLLPFLYRCSPLYRNYITILVHITTVHMWRWFHGLVFLILILSFAISTHHLPTYFAYTWSARANNTLNYLLGTSDWINSFNIFPSSLLLFASMTDSRLQIWNLSTLSFNERTRSKKITSQKRKSPATTGRTDSTDSIHINCKRVCTIVYSKLRAVPIF